MSIQQAFNPGVLRQGAVSYGEVHQWLIRVYKKATKCENLECKGKSKVYDYALIKGLRYEKVRENYKQLCKSCHSKYDQTEETLRKFSEFRKGKKFRAMPVYRISKDGSKKRYESATEAGLDNKVSRQGICNCACGRSKTCAGYKWEYAPKIKTK